MQCDNFLTGYGIQNEGGMHSVNIYEGKSFSVDNLKGAISPYYLQSIAAIDNLSFV